MNADPATFLGEITAEYQAIKVQRDLADGRMKELRGQAKQIMDGVEARSYALPGLGQWCIMASGQASFDKVGFRAALVDAFMAQSEPWTLETFSMALDQAFEGATKKGKGEPYAKFSPGGGEATG
jgi:hypothetical protein